MPKLTVQVNEKPVTLEGLDEQETLTMVACQLEEKNYGVNPAYPTIMVDGSEVSPLGKVNFNLLYKFGKPCASLSVTISFYISFQLLRLRVKNLRRVMLWT